MLTPLATDSSAEMEAWVITTKLTPAPPTFTNFQDNAAGGSVQLVRAAGVPYADYRYRIGVGSIFRAVPSNGLIVVGDIAGPVYAYSVENATRNQSDTAMSDSFTTYTPPVIPGTNVPSTPLSATSELAGTPTLLRIRWVAPVSSGSSLITGYQVYLVNSNATTTLLGTTTGDLYYDDALATNFPGVARSYKIAATNSVGKSDFSAATTPLAVPATTAPPSPVYNVTLSRSVPNEPNGADGGQTTLSLVDAYSSWLFRFQGILGGDSDGKRMDMNIGSDYVGAVDFPVSYISTPCYLVSPGNAIYKAVFSNATITFTLV